LLRLTERCKQAAQSGRYCVADCSPSSRRRRQTTTLSATTVGRWRKDGDYDGGKTADHDGRPRPCRVVGRTSAKEQCWSLVSVRTTALDDGRLRRQLVVSDKTTMLDVVRLRRWSLVSERSTALDVGRRRSRLVVHSDQKPVDVLTFRCGRLNFTMASDSHVFRGTQAVHNVNHALIRQSVHASQANEEYQRNVAKKLTCCCLQHTTI